MARHASIEIDFHSPAICVLTLCGEHDAASSEAVARALVAGRGRAAILVDLASCTFVDSTLITVLLVAARNARELGGTLELVLPIEQNAVRRTLEIANVQMLLPFHASLPDAISETRERTRSPASTVGAPAPPRDASAGTGRTTVIRALVETDDVTLTPGVPASE